MKQAGQIGLPLSDARGAPPCQRWADRRDSYRPAGEPIDVRRFGVEVIEERAARGFVVRHHYSATFPSARRSVGLFRTRGAARAELVGVAVFSVGVQPAAIRSRLGVPAPEGVELGRFVLKDDVEANGETWFLARAFRALALELPEVRGVLSYSDPLARAAEDGRVITPGHVGTIYQAFNGRYVGRTKPGTLWLAPDGSILAPRGLSKLRNDERGAASVYERLRSFGAPARKVGEGGPEYVARALASGPFRRVLHPGNHAYVWPLRGRLPLPAAMAYPKRSEHPATT
jgi:hypothetical protein